MRIAQIAPLTEAIPPKLYGGTERVIYWLTEELVALGHDITLFASGDSQTSANLVPVWPKALRLDGAVRDADVRITSRRRKSMRVNSACVREDSWKAIHVVRRTKLRIGDAMRTTADTVAAKGPGPAHGVTNRDVDRARVERESTTGRHHHIDNRARSRRDAAHGRLAVLIDNSEWRRTPFVRRTCAPLARFSAHQKSDRKNGCDPKN